MAPADHPVRLVVSDDLKRSRRTVLFRLLLAVPHFLWLALVGQAVLVVVFAQWWVLLFTGRPAKGVHGFVRRFLRYGTQLEAYVVLVADPYPPFFLLSDESKPYPVDLTVGPPEPQNRWKTFFRLILAGPAFLLAAALGVSGTGGYLGGGTLGTSAFLGWFASLARGRMPRGLRDLGAWSVGYGAQAGAYLLLLTDRYPYTSPRAHVLRAPADEGALPDPPARLVVTEDLRRSRLLALLRLPLLAPHIVWSLLWGLGAVVVGILNWFGALAIGRSPRPFARFLSAFVRYQAHLNAFAYLVANPFPGFVGKPGSYPVDLQLDASGPQRRIVTGFRLVLGLPALLLMGAASGVTTAVAILGWFVALALGRMPEGLRDAGAWGVGYTGQAFTYLFVLDERYPFSGPPLTIERPEPDVDTIAAAAAA